MNEKKCKKRNYERGSRKLSRSWNEMQRGI